MENSKYKLQVALPENSQIYQALIISYHGEPYYKLWYIRYQRYFQRLLPQRLLSGRIFHVMGDTQSETRAASSLGNSPPGTHFMKPDSASQYVSLN